MKQKYFIFQNDNVIQHETLYKYINDLERDLNKVTLFDNIVTEPEKVNFTTKEVYTENGILKFKSSVSHMIFSPLTLKSIAFLCFKYFYTNFYDKYDPSKSMVKECVRLIFHYHSCISRPADTLSARA